MKQKIQDTISYKVANSGLVLTLLNVMYGVFLGVFAQYLVIIGTEEITKTPTVEYLITKNNCIFLFAFLIYFVIDWFSANITLIFEEGVNHLILILAILFIFWLGFMLINAIEPNNYLFLSFSIYSAIASSLDIRIKYSLNESNELQEIWKKYVFFIIRLLFSFILLFFSILLILNANLESELIMKSLCYLFLAFIIIAKIIRYFVLVYSKLKYDLSITLTT
ncbi:MAG: hypothetical protein Q8K92_06255 [Leadbetterella sp.]|nr:hypothetical protein [Leadbetterella sp.]